MPQIKVPKPKAIVMDMSGTAVKSGFIDKILLPYVRNNVKAYVEEKWSDKTVKKDIDRLRKESQESEKKIAASEANVAEQQQSVVDYILWALDNKKETKAISQFRFHMWFDAYDNNKLQTPVYSDVAIQVKKWKDLDIKIYVLSNSWYEMTKKSFSNTTQGDLNLMIDGHFDTSLGALNEKDTYNKLIEKIGFPKEEILFLTKSGEEGRTAKEAGLPVVLVMTHRKDIEKLNEEEKQMQRIRTFNELEFDSQTN